VRRIKPENLKSVGHNVTRFNGPQASGEEAPRSRKFERLVEAHCRIDEALPRDHEIGFICSCFVRYSLPHSASAENVLGRRDGDMEVAFLSPPNVGLPFGKVPRLLLIYLTTQAVRTRKREIDLGVSISKFMKSLFTEATGGTHGSIARFKQQVLRTLSLTTTLSLLNDDRAQLTNTPVADEFEVHWVAVGADQRSGMPARVRLGERMFDHMLGSAVPVDLRAVRALKQSAMALDVYFWTTYRAPRVARTHPARIAWGALQAQFGSDYKSKSDFKISFCNALMQVQMVYPSLRYLATESYLVLHKSAPSVPRKTRPETLTPTCG